MTVRRNESGAAYVVAVSMGYGHERAASALRSIAVGKQVILANSYEGMPASDRKLWQTGQTWYERISRFKRVPVFGSAAFGVMDKMQEIEPFCTPWLPAPRVTKRQRASR